MGNTEHGRHVDEVYEQIRREILTLSYAPGTPLRLKALTELHGGSMIPIREALRRLEAERLVDVVPNQGARVSEISMHDLEDVYSTRKVVEVEALRRAAGVITAEELNALRQLASNMDSKFANNEIEEGLELHQEFHFAMYELSGSDWLMRLIDLLWSHADRYRRVAALKRPSSDIAHEHESIVDALERNDANAACAALTHHLERTAQVTREEYAEATEAQRPEHGIGISG